VKGDLHKAFTELGSDFDSTMNLTLVPYGNAHSKGNKVTCQHGELECEGNRWEQCGIAHYPDPAVHYPFYNCMEKVGTPWKTNVKKCAAEAKMDLSILRECFNGKESQELQKKFAALTPADHKYTPWVVIDGLEWNQKGSFLSAVCKAFKGTKPPGCKKAERDFSNSTEAKYELDFFNSTEVLPFHDA